MNHSQASLPRKCFSPTPPRAPLRRATAWGSQLPRCLSCQHLLRTAMKSNNCRSFTVATCVLCKELSQEPRLCCLKIPQVSSPVPSDSSPNTFTELFRLQALMETEPSAELLHLLQCKGNHQAAPREGPCKNTFS